MSRLFKHKIGIMTFSFFIMLIIEILMLLIIFNKAMPNYFILEISFIIYLLLPGILFKSNIGTSIYCGVFVLLFAVMFGINTTLSFASDDIFSFKYIMLADEAVAVFSADFINWWYLLIIILVLGVFVAGILLSFKFYKYDKKETGHLKLRLSLYMLSSILSIFCRSVSYDVIKNDLSSKPIYEDKTGLEIIEFTTNNLKRSSMQNYGLVSYVIADATNLLPIKTEEDLDNIDKFLTSGSALLDSKMFGTCKNMNVLTIMIETGCSFAINEYLTPTLYKLMNEGIYFSNSLTKNKTNVSEFIGIAGSATTSATIERLPQTNIPYSLPNMLEKQGYDTNYFHCNYSTFYSRYNVIEALGFNNKYFVDYTPELEWHNNYNGNYPLDTEFYDLVKDKMIPEKSDKPFYSFWSTLSTHGPYDFPFANKNRQKFTDLGYYNRIKEATELGLWENICADDSLDVQGQIEWYQCAMMNLDAAVAGVFERLVATNQLQNTLVILYGDHELYYQVGIPQALKNYIYDLDDPFVPYQYETIMMMYNPTLVSQYKKKYNIPISENAVYKDYVSPYIIVPSVLDLLGIQYYENSYIGKSVFSTSSQLDNIFYSHELNIYFSDKLLSSELGEFEYINTDDEKYINSFNNHALSLIDKIDKFNYMYENAYYGKNK